jgi:hypothetical protein
MKAYLAQLPPLAWVGLLIPVLALARVLLAAAVHAAVPQSVSGFLRLL